MKVRLDKLASFRINSERWEKFKEVAETQNKTATDLLNEYIDRMIGVGVGVADAPKISIRDIDKRIDARMRAASIQDIDNAVKQQIANSLEDGDIGEAINKAYGAMMGQFNAVLEEMHALQSQFAKLANSPAMGNRTAELEIPHNKQQIIRAALHKKHIKVSSDQIRKAFKAAGWNGNNFEAIRNDILEILSK